MRGMSRAAVLPLIAVVGLAATLQSIAAPAVPAQLRRRPFGVALVQGQHPHPHPQQRRRQHAGRGDALVQGARLPVPGAERSQRPHRVDGLNALHGAGAVPARAGRGGDRRSSARSRCTSTGSTSIAWSSRSTAPASSRRCSATSTPSARRAACRTSTTRTSAGRSPPTSWQRRSATLLEIYNGHPTVNNLGGGGRPGSRRSGTGCSPPAGASTASPSTTRTTSSARGIRRRRGPGRGWVVVRAPRLEAAAIVDGARARRLLRLHRRRTRRLQPPTARRSPCAVQAERRHPLPHRPGRSRRRPSNRATGAGGALRAGRPLRLRPRGRHRLQWRDGVGAAGVSRLAAVGTSGLGARDGAGQNTGPGVNAHK